MNLAEMNLRSPTPRPADLIARQHRVPSRSADWLTLALHEKHRADITPATAAGVVLFVHGATLSSVLHDIPVPGRSWVEDLAHAGFIVFALDVRGYGGSTRPTSFASPPDGNPPFARAAEVIHDIDDAVDLIRACTGMAHVNLIGGSWGSVTSGLYAATIGAAKIGKLVLYAPLFGRRNQGWLDWIEDPATPGCLHPDIGAYRLVTVKANHARWLAELEAAGDTSLLEPTTFDALMRAFLATDPTAGARTPQSVRVPNGTLADLLEVFTARPLFRPEDITCPALLIRGANDPTSTAADAELLLSCLGSRDKSLATVSPGTHFVSAEVNAPEVYAHARRFLLAKPQS
jgi:alpha-beta hydrolase superfamily lysophospholipase